MKRPPIYNPDPLPTDNDAMRNAIEALIELGVKFSRPGSHHLKVGPLNFYPNTGRIYQDGDAKAWETHGLEAFIAHLRTLHLDFIDLGSLIAD